MAVTGYYDLIWHLTDDGAASAPGQAGLQVFSNEAGLFGPAREPGAKPGTLPRSARTMRVALPLADLPADWARAGASPDELKAMGRRLWDAIPAGAKRRLAEPTMRRPRRLKISSESPAIQDLPWEWLNDGQGPPFALRDRTRVTRAVPIPVPVPPLTVGQPVKVLLVLTNPRDERLLNSAEEIAAVRPSLDRPPYALQVLEEPTWEALVAALQDGPHIVHYIGHAGIDRGAGNLILQDSQGVSHWINGADLAAALPLSTRLLCLATCFTAPNYDIRGLGRLADLPARYRLPTAIANRYPVGPMGAVAFWQSFYDALIREGGHVGEAFHAARLATASTAGADWGSFSLVVREQLGEVMRLAEAGEVPQERYAKELQAQVASYLANDMAVRVKSLGAQATRDIREESADRSGAAAELAKGL